MKSQTFNTGNTGSTIATSDTGAGGDAFNEVIRTAGGAAVYSTTHPALGPKGATLTAATIGDQAVLGWTSFSANSLALAFNLYVAAYPSGTTDIAAIRNGTGNAGKVQLGSDGKLRVTNAAGTSVKTFTNAIGLGAQVRIELVVDKGTTTSNGRLRCAYSPGASVTATDQYDSGLTANAGTTTLTTTRVGVISNTTTATLFVDSVRADAVSTFLGFWDEAVADFQRSGGAWVLRQTLSRVGGAWV